jgi:hypothetical protein
VNFAVTASGTRSFRTIWKTLLGSASGSVHRASLLLELDNEERLLLELDETLDPLESDEFEPLLRDELLLGDERLLLEDGGELALLDDPLDDEPLDSDDELLDGGVYTLLELRLDVDELLLGGGGRTGGGDGPHGGAQLGGYGG